MLPRSHTLPSRIHHGAVEERHDIRHHLQVEVQPKTQGETEAINPQSNYSKCFDDDGRLKRTVTFWTATAHITAVIGAGDPVTGQRNYTYMDVVKANLGGRKVMLCGLIQYLNLFGIATGYTITASVSMMAIMRSNCFHKSGGKDPCHMSSNGHMITFGIIEVFFSQIPDFDQVRWLSIVAAIMSFTYSSVGLGLGLGKVAESGKFKGSLMGISIGTLTKAGTVPATQKMWRSLQALGAIAFAYSFSIILIEIQDTIRSPPAEHKTMKKATLFSITITTVFYLLCGCIGYASFGDLPPGSLLTGFGFYNPYWLLDIANIAIVVHLLGTYQLNLFRLVWRTIFVIMTALTSMLFPFFNDVVGILGAFGFWPLTVFFPIEMYISQKKIAPWTSRWVGLQIITVTCLFIFIAAAVGSFAGLVRDLKTYKPFKTSY
nr:amino acid permease 2 [Quercus suber]